ncbi:MAG: hypothetical protein ACJAYE_000147 [Candidatus Azotimanducaceae bacterium]|jgi:hypothetical protein
MAKIFWYINRLQMMSAGEIAWRIRMLLADIAESIRVLFGIVPEAPQNAWPSSTEKFYIPLQDSELPDHWKASLMSQANSILQGELTYFSHIKKFVGNPPKWRTDHAAEIEGPLNLIQFVNYRDFNNFGDCKEVWEPNRHHHLVVLSRAFFVTKDEKYAEAAAKQLDDWIVSNPYGRGMNWRSPLELGIRLINWVWTLELLKTSGALTEDRKKAILDAVYQQCRDITRKFSQGSSANNHLIGEAAGVFVASCYFDQFEESVEWRQASQKILEQEILSQSYSDGCTREHALGYQLFVIQFFVTCGLVGNWYSFGFSEKFWQRLEKMFQFVSAVSLAGGTLPFFGDRDDGYVLDLGEDCGDTAMLRDLENRIFEVSNADAKVPPSQTCFWLLPERSTAPSKSTSVVRSQSFPESGYHLLQSNQHNAHVAVFLDAADLGYESIAAHGHADALSLTLRLNNRDIFIDAGTYDYFSFPEWRNYFRSTRAHNTVEIDGLDQSDMQGAFMWGQHASCTLATWEDTDQKTLITASHNGYERLSDPVTHTRTLTLEKPEQKLSIRDRLDCESNHLFAIHFHCHPDVIVQPQSDNVIVLVSGQDRIQLRSDQKISILRGAEANETPGLGWYSPGYHQKVTTTVLKIEGTVTGNTTLTTELSWA